MTHTHMMATNDIDRDHSVRRWVTLSLASVQKTDYLEAAGETLVYFVISYPSGLGIPVCLKLCLSLLPGAFQERCKAFPTISVLILIQRPGW